MKLLNTFKRLLYKLKDMSIQREISDITRCIEECHLNREDLRERAQRLAVTESFLRMLCDGMERERENHMRLLDAYEQVEATAGCTEFPR